MERLRHVRTGTLVFYYVFTVLASAKCLLREGTVYNLLLAAAASVMFPVCRVVYGSVFHQKARSCARTGGCVQRLALHMDVRHDERRAVGDLGIPCFLLRGGSAAGGCDRCRRHHAGYDRVHGRWADYCAFLLEIPARAGRKPTYRSDDALV